jgi:hypothetical protein
MVQLGTKKKQHSLGTIDKTYVIILLVIFGGIVLQGPISVGLGTLFPHYDLLIKSWKEILMLVAGILAFIILRQKKQTAILKEPLMVGIAIYAALHLLSLLVFGGTAASIEAGLAIDLRYVLFFGLVYIAVRLYPEYTRTFIKVGIAGALVVVVFALLQVFVLPPDILKYLGYNANTIVPYLTVDQNSSFIRINSTLRGPNPLGAYAAMVLSIVVGWLISKRTSFKDSSPLIVIVLLVGGIVSLWASYSRSALIGVVVALAIVLVATNIKRHKKAILVGAAIILIALGMGIVATRNTDFISNVVLHDNPVGGSSTKSDQGHLSSLQAGLNRALGQPFGAGIGSTGSASLYGNAPLIIENQYLLIAHEVGWVGLAFFVMVFVGILSRLWQRRGDWLALGVFASGIGLAVIGLLLPVWTDDTISIVWWALAAIVIGGRRD